MTALGQPPHSVTVSRLRLWRVAVMVGLGTFDFHLLRHTEQVDLVRRDRCGPPAGCPVPDKSAGSGDHYLRGPDRVANDQAACCPPRRAVIGFERVPRQLIWPDHPDLQRCLNRVFVLCRARRVLARSRLLRRLRTGPLTRTRERPGLIGNGSTYPARDTGLPHMPRRVCLQAIIRVTVQIEPVEGWQRCACRGSCQRDAVAKLHQ
jgi:hypothetical protein